MDPGRPPQRLSELVLRQLHPSRRSSVGLGWEAQVPGDAVIGRLGREEDAGHPGARMCAGPHQIEGMDILLKSSARIRFRKMSSRNPRYRSKRMSV